MKFFEKVLKTKTIIKNNDFLIKKKKYKVLMKVAFTHY